MLALVQRLTSLIAAPVCVLCNGDGQQLDEAWGLDLCRWCEQACFPLGNACPRCGESDAARTTCNICQHHPPPYDATVCLFRYQNPVDLLITNLKFRHELASARVLGMLFARRLGTVRALPRCLVPIPLHSSRYRERGFNQTLEIARHLAPRVRDAAGNRLEIRTDLLQRCRATHAQSELTAAGRAANLVGAFRAESDVSLPPHIALLDDVMTTGHTAAAAALALKAAGCQRVEIWACARALRLPDPTGPAGSRPP